jgi:ketosteroid isomerase-like protein
VARSNAELVRFALASWNDDDFERARTIMHPDVRWYSSGAFPGFEPLYVGPDQVREWWTALKEPWEKFDILIHELIEEGDKVISLVHFDAVGKESGVAVSLQFGNVFEFRDGLVVRFAAYPSWDEARADPRADDG